MLPLLAGIKGTSVKGAAFRDWWLIGVIVAVIFFILIIVLIICCVKHHQGEDYYGKCCHDYTDNSTAISSLADR